MFQQVGPTHCLKCHQNIEDFANHTCTPASTSACTPECGRFYKSKDPFERLWDNPHDAKYDSPEDLRGRLVNILRDKWGASFPEVAAEIAALLEEKKEELCVRGDDVEFERLVTMGYFDNRYTNKANYSRVKIYAEGLVKTALSDLKTRILDRGPLFLAGEINKETEGWNKACEEWRKIITEA